MLKKPMTTEELFNKIREILKEKGKLPDILDYGLAAHNPVPIRTYEFDLKSNLTYGGNEGIYLSLWIEYFVNDERHTNSVGTFKTLDESNEAMCAVIVRYICTFHQREMLFLWITILYPICRSTFQCVNGFAAAGNQCGKIF